MDLEELFEQTDRSMHATLDAALGRTFRALVEHEKSVHVTLHAGLYGPDRSIVELITESIPTHAALTKIKAICRTQVIRNGDPDLSADFKPVFDAACRIAAKRNELAHQVVEPTDDNGRYFSLVTVTERLTSDVSPESLETLRADARSSTLALYSIARRLLAVLHDLPKTEPTGHWIGVYAHDLSSE